MHKFLLIFSALLFLPASHLHAEYAQKPIPSQLEELPEEIPQEVLEKLVPEQAKARVDQKQINHPSTAQVIFNQQIIVPGIVFGTMGGIAFLILYFSYRKRRDLLNLVQDAIRSGHTLPNSFLESLENKKKPTADSDLRKAVLLMAVGPSASVILLILADDAQKGAASIGILPTLLGLAYLFLYKSSKKNNSSISSRIDE